MSVNHERVSWLLDKRREVEERYDRVFAADYDLRFPEVGETHLEFVRLVADTLNEDSWVLDVGCGTGKHWPTVFLSGARIIGVDISAQMLRRAKEKFPYVTLHQQAVQDLSLSEKFDAVLFVDVFEMIGPEDWPLVLGNLRSTLSADGILYFTVPDRPDETQLEQSLLLSRQRGIPAVLGELAHGLSYEFFPTDSEINEWLGTSTFVVSKEGTGDGYRHYLPISEG